jgi:hypothetical protein
MNDKTNNGGQPPPATSNGRQEQGATDARVDVGQSSTVPTAGVKQEATDRNIEEQTERLIQTLTAKGGAALAGAGLRRIAFITTSADLASALRQAGSGPVALGGLASGGKPRWINRVQRTREGVIELQARVGVGGPVESARLAAELEKHGDSPLALRLDGSLFGPYSLIRCDETEQMIIIHAGQIEGAPRTEFFDQALGPANNVGNLCTALRKLPNGGVGLAVHCDQLFIHHVERVGVLWVGCTMKGVGVPQAVGIQAGGERPVLASAVADGLEPFGEDTLVVIMFNGALSPAVEVVAHKDGRINIVAGGEVRHLMGPTPAGFS